MSRVDRPDTARAVACCPRAASAGWLNGLAPLAALDPMLKMATGVHVSLFYGMVLGAMGIPLAGIPLQAIVREIERGRWEARPAMVLEVGEI